MSSERRRGIHWFRNDLRLHDNLALGALADSVDAWLPIFVLDPELAARTNPAAPRMRFLLDSVARLARDLASRGVELIVLEGQPEKVIPEAMARTAASVVSWNAAPTPLGRRRDERVREAIRELGGEAIEQLDHTVFAPDEIRTKAGGFYSVYTPYRNAWWAAWEQAPRRSSPRVRLPRRPIETESLEGSVALPSVPDSESGQKLPTGGEAAAIRRLRSFLEGPARRYHEDRDRPALDGTSRLSPHLRFGTISIRRCVSEGLDAVQADRSLATGVSKWLDELVWREFYHAVLAHSPHVLGRCFRPEYDAIDWPGSTAHFEAWCAGQTGYPFVDAGMRQLRETGWMHNRVRMIVASFLTKDLHVDWRRGERFFFESLVDGDPASNNGGWQWAASTGTDAQPYFRIFNPVAQGERWDPQGHYVRRWVPELRGVEDRFVHAPWKAPAPPAGYPAPIVDHAEARVWALEEFKRVRALGDSA